MIPKSPVLITKKEIPIYIIVISLISIMVYVVLKVIIFVKFVVTIIRKPITID